MLVHLRLVLQTIWKIDDKNTFGVWRYYKVLRNNKNNVLKFVHSTVLVQFYTCTKHPLQAMYMASLSEDSDFQVTALA